MNTSKKVLVSILVTLGLIAFIGCGVSKEEHERAISELNKTKAELAQAKIRMADMGKSLNEARAQAKSQAEKPSPAETAAVERKSETVDTGMQDMLAAAQKEATDLRAKIEMLTEENATLKGMLDKLKAQYAEIQKKLGGGVQMPTPQIPAKLPKRP